MANVNWWEESPLAEESDNWWEEAPVYKDKQQPSRQFDPSRFIAPSPSPVSKKPQDGVIRQALDIPVNIARGGVQGIKMMTDILGADNPISKSLSGVEGYMADLLSAQAKDDQEEIARILKDAEDKGFGEQVMAGIKAFSIAPVDIMSQALGTMIPVVATGLAGSAAKLGAVGIRAVQAGVGAGSGAGLAKGNIYSEVKQELLNAGIGEQEAERAAVEAQSYGGKNLDQILLSAGLGAASTIGAESIITRILTKQGKPATGGIVSRTIKGGLAEGIPESAQAAQEELATNIALQREGFDVPTMRGVVSAGTMEGIAGAAIGAPVGALERSAPLKPKTPAEESLEQTTDIARKVAESGAPLTASVLQDQAAENVRQEELAKQLAEEFEEEERSMVPIQEEKEPYTLPSKEDFKERFATQTPEQIVASESAFQSNLTNPDADARAFAQTGLEALQEFRQSQAPAPETEAIVEPPTETPAPQEAINDLQSVANNTATRKQISALSEAGLVDIIKGQPVINEDGEAILAQAQAPLPALTPEERVAEIEGAPTAQDTAQDTAQVTAQVEAPAIVEQAPVVSEEGAQVSEVTPAPTISEKPPTSPMIGAEPTQPAPAEGVAPAISITEVVPQEVLDTFSENQPIMERIRKDALEKRGGSLQTYITTSIRTKGAPKSQIQSITNKVLKQFEESASLAEVEEAVTNEVEKISSIKEKKKSDEVKLQAALQRTGETYELDTAIQDYKNKLIELERAQKSMLSTPALRQMERVGAKNNLEKSKQNLISIAERVTLAPETAEPTAPAGPTVGNRIKLGKSPQTYTIEEVIPQSETEKDLGEQYYSVKNEKTGETQVVEAKDLKVVQGKGVRRMAAQTQDARFAELEARAKSGDKEAEAEAQRMVDEAAKPSDRISKEIFATLMWGNNDTVNPDDFLYDSSVRRVIEDGGDIWDYQRRFSGAQPWMSADLSGKQKQDLSEWLWSNNAKLNDIQSIEDVARPPGYPENDASKAMRMGVVAYAKLHQSAAPFTYDDAGNLIPLSERFQPTTPDIRRMSDLRVTEEQVAPVPKERQYSFEDIEKRVKKYFGGTIPENAVIVNDTTEDYQFKGGYNTDNGQLIINQAYIEKGDSISDIINHELGHYIFGDPEFQAAFKSFYDSMTPDEKSEIDAIINTFYNEDTGQVQIEEGQVMAFNELVDKAKTRSTWGKLVDAIKSWLNKTFGTSFELTDRGALAVLAAGHKRFKSGEKIVREMDAGIMAMAADTQDSRFADLERRAKAGDKEAEAEAQRMVDEVARTVGYDSENLLFHGTTHIFNVFKKDRANIENDLGKGYYFTNTENDAQVNYAGEGPDLTNRIERLAEQLESNEEIPREEAISKAKEILSGGEQRIINAYLRLDNPFVIGSPNETFLDYNENFDPETEEYGEPSGKLLEFIENFREVASEYEGATPEEGVQKLMEAAMGYDGLAASEIIKILKEDGSGIMYAEDSNGDLASSEIIREAIEATGFDGIVDTLVNQKFGSQKRIGKAMAGMEQGTVHTVAFNSNQIKSSAPFTYDDAGNLIPLSERFQAASPDIRRMAVGSDIPRQQQRSEQLFGNKDVGLIIETPVGFFASTDEIVKRDYFDGSTVSQENTDKAFGLIEALTDPQDGSNYAKSIVADVAAKMPDVKDAVLKSVAVVRIQNELMRYAVKLAIKGDKSLMKQLYLRANRMPTGMDETVSQAGRTLSARQRILDPTIAALDIIQASDTEQAAAVVFGTKNPNKDQIDVVKEALTETENVKMDNESEILDGLTEVETRANVNLTKKIDEKIKKAGKKKKKVKDVVDSTEAGKEEFSQLDEEAAAAAIKQKAQTAISRKADNIIESLAKLQSDVYVWPQSKTNDIRTIVQQDLRQRPDMGRKEPWISMLTGKLTQAGVSDSQAQTIAELVWRQHEINSMNREIAEMEKAAEFGSLGGIIQRIKDTPLLQQQGPDWREGVIREYLLESGLSEKAAESAARLYNSVIVDRLAQAQQKAFEDTLKKSAPWKDYFARNARLAKGALEKIRLAVRTGALDPSKNLENVIAEQNGWTGFTSKQFQRLAELDEIISDPNVDDVTRSESIVEINKIVTDAKLPVRLRDGLAAYYTGQALMGIPTALVNIASPAGFSLRNLFTDIAKYSFSDPSQIPFAFESFMESMRSYYDQVSYAFKNQIYRNDVVEYLAGNNTLRELFNKGKRQWEQGNYAEGFVNMSVGMAQITGRVLSSLDQGAISALEGQNINRYTMEAMKMSNIPKDKQKFVANKILEARRKTKAQLVSEGMPAERAGVLADLEVRSLVMTELSDLNVDFVSVLESSLNEALQAVGRNRVLSIKGLEEEQKTIRDEGLISYPPIAMLELVAQGAAKQGPAMQIFARMLYGFALVPARVFHNAAWYSPYGFVRIGIEAAGKKTGLWSPRYAASLGNELQYRQRLTDAIAGSIVMLALASLMSSSVDDEDEDKAFRIVITGNGPDAATDRQFYDSWIKKWKQYSIHIVIKGTIIPINIGRSGEAIFFPIMLAAALDDWQIKGKLNQTRKSPQELNMATQMAGSAFFALAQRGPFAAFTKPLFDASKEGRVTEELIGNLGFFGKTFIPGIGASVTRNISDFINDPIDRSSAMGAIYANTPMVGPMMGSKALNALGQPMRVDDWGDRLFRLGVPVVFSFPKNTPENDLNELILKKGSGPSFPTRRIAQARVGRPLDDNEFETYVREYGRVMSDKMFKNRKRLENMKVSDYDKELQRYAQGFSIDGTPIPGASDMAVRAVNRMAK